MNIEVYKEMCSQIYEGESWDRMINCLERKDKEIERLNNIINELEKWLDDRQNSSVFYEEYENADVYGIVLDKLQELKGSNNNEQ